MKLLDSQQNHELNFYLKDIYQVCRVKLSKYFVLVLFYFSLKKSKPQLIYILFIKFFNSCYHFAFFFTL
ncbi:MAG: hypothetical protein DWQ05_13570 [Calditrichaeota bacterium]|nr:MAG: hypothetical protein DWQ05_13570 [Calditrichota bacterium]